MKDIVLSLETPPFSDRDCRAVGLAGYHCDMCEEVHRDCFVIIGSSGVQFTRHSDIARLFAPAPAGVTYPMNVQRGSGGLYDDLSWGTHFLEDTPPSEICFRWERRPASVVLRLVTRSGHRFDCGNLLMIEWVTRIIYVPSSRAWRHLGVACDESGRAPIISSF